MYRYKRLLVGLAGAERDRTTIEYAAMVSRMAKAEKTYFVHVARSLEIPESIRKAYPELLEPVDEHLAKQMGEMVEERFSCHPETEVAFEVVAGAPLVEILRLTRQKEIDLILVGKTKEHQKSGMLQENLARKAPCSVMIVPEGSKPQITKILVPVDFSEHSSDAMDVAIAFCKACAVPEIGCLHAFKVPSRYLGSDVSHEQFAELMRSDVENKCQMFIKNRDLNGCLVKPQVLLAKNPSQAITQASVEQQVDLLVVGARGRALGAALLLGSVTERLIRSVDIPLIAVKKKGTGLSLLDALFPP